MGQSNSNFELASEARRAAERFDECEIKVIKETFKDLCHLNGGSMRIDKETFLQYLPLPGLLGERLFAVFDKKCSGEIDYEEFVCGLAVTCRGSWDEKVEFIFNIYDMHGQGAVNREELAALLNHVPKSIMRFGRAVALDSAAENHQLYKRRSSAPASSNQNHPNHRPSHHPGSQQQQNAGHPPQNPRHPSAGTASSAFCGGRGSPDRSPDRYLRAATAGGGAAARGLAASSAADGTVVSGAVESRGMGGGDGGAESRPLLTSGNLMQLHESLSSHTVCDGDDGAGLPLGGGGGGVLESGGFGGDSDGSAAAEQGASAESAVAAAGAMASDAKEAAGTTVADADRAAAAGAAIVAASATPGSWIAIGGGEGDSLSSFVVDKEADIGSNSSRSSGHSSSGNGSSPPPPPPPSAAGESASAQAVGSPMLAVDSPAGAAEGGSPGGEGGGGSATAASHAGGIAAHVASRGAGGGTAVSSRGEGSDTLVVVVVEGTQGVEEGEEEERRELAAAAAADAADVAVHDSGVGPAELMARSAGGGSGSRRRRDRPRSDSSTDVGVSFAVPQHHPHWEEFTNNDIVDQAFEECDLNHNGKLSFNEFRLWVERNPIVTQFLQSVFPYDEHRNWGDDRKHLPFIHNREFTASPVRSDPSVGGELEASDEETRRLLIKARNTTRDDALREGIDRLIEQVAGTSMGEGPLASLSLGGSMEITGNSQHVVEGLRIQSDSRANLGRIPARLLSELSPRSAKVMQNQTVAKQGFLWKQGYRLKTWKQGWYVLVGNCIYYYRHEVDVYPSKVMFLTGSFVEPLNEVANERKGYWGIEISRNREQNHRRRWYTRSKVEQLKWVKELRKASAVVPIEDDFEIGDELGKGRFSRVCMCVNKHTLERKAVKIIMKENMKQDERDLLRAEIAIMRLVNHPNIIRMEAVYESKKDIFIVMQLHSGGELFDRIVGRPRFTEDEAFTIIYPLVESVAYLHEMGIVHRDLKPENILCGDKIEDIKIADFGLSKMVMPDEIMKMPCGTLTYVAPEVLTLKGYGKEADIWSVGTIMYLLLRGRLPFDGETREEIIENTIHGTIAVENDPVWANFSDDGKDLLLGMLNKDQSRRYTAKHVLAHRWITTRELRREENPELFDFDF